MRYVIYFYKYYTKYSLKTAKVFKIPMYKLHKSTIDECFQTLMCF